MKDAGLPLRQDVRRALSRCHSKSASGLRLTDFQAAATASRHVVGARLASARRPPQSRPAIRNIRRAIKLENWQGESTTTLDACAGPQNDRELATDRDRGCGVARTSRQRDRRRLDVAFERLVVGLEGGGARALATWTENDCGSSLGRDAPRVRCPRCRACDGDGEDSP